LRNGDGRSEEESSVEGESSDGDEGTGAEAASGKGSSTCYAHGKDTCSGQAGAAGCESTWKITRDGAFRADTPCTQARGSASRASATAPREAP